MGKTILSERDFKQFLKLLRSRKKPNKALSKAAEKYNDAVENGEIRRLDTEDLEKILEEN